MDSNNIGGFGGGFVNGLRAGAQFASQFQEADLLDREQQQSSEMAEKWKKLREDQDANAAATQSDLALAAQPTPATAPSMKPIAGPSLAPEKPEALQDYWKEATEQDGPPDTRPMDASTRPMDASTRAKMPGQVPNRSAGNGIGAGMATLLHAPAADKPAILETGAPAPDTAPQSAATMTPPVLRPAGTAQPTVPAVASQTAPAPEAAPAAEQPKGFEQYWAEAGDASGPPDITPMSDAARAQMPPQVDNPSPGNGRGAGIAAIRAAVQPAPAVQPPPAEGAPRMVKTSAPADAPAAAPQPAVASTAGAAPAPVSVNELGSLRGSGDQPAAKKHYTYDDFLNDKIQTAARLGLSDEVNKGIAESISRKYNTAAMKALYAGDYNEVFRLHNLLPDGYSVKREVVPAGTDGSPGGVKLTMVNDKTGQVYGQPQTFASDKEAAGAMVEGAQKNLSDWLYKNMTLDAKHRELNLTDKLRRDDLKEREWYHGRVTTNQRAAINQKYDAVDARYANGGSGSGSRSGKTPADSLDYTKYAEWVAGKDGSGGVSTWAPTGYRTYQQILDNNPLLAASEGGKAMALEMSANVARTSANPDAPAQAPGMANYRVLPMLKRDGTWAAGVTDENGRAYYLENNVNPASLIRKDKDGKTIGGIDDTWIKQQEVGFMQNYAKANPTKYSQLVAAAQDKSKLTDLPALSPADTAVLRMADKYGPNPTAAAPAAGSAPTAPAAPRQIFTPAELQDAKSLGVEPTVPLATRLGNAWAGVKSAVSSATDFSPESFGRYVANARRTGRFDADAQLMMAAMQRNPELAKQLTPQELNAVQVAANKRL